MTRQTTSNRCPHCGGNQSGTYSYPGGWQNMLVAHKPDCPDPTAAAIDSTRWDKLKAAGTPAACARPFGPSREGSTYCTSGSIASGGSNEYCTCDWCF